MRAGEAPFLGSYPYSTLIKTIQVEDHMLRSKYMKITVAVLMATSLQITSAIAEIKPRAAGRVTAKAANTILNGKGAPLTSKGIDGDFYIDTRSLSIYGPKANGKWPAAQSLQGATGTDGKNGNDGKSTTNASSSGAAGAVGPAGPIGLTGLTGPQGDPGTGVGPTGPAGPTGPTGATGAAGSSGSSQVKVSLISSFSIASHAPYTSASSTTFQTVSAGTSHRFTIIMYGTGTTAVDEPFGIELIGTNSPTINSTYTISEHNTVTGVATKAIRYMMVLEATVVVGALQSALAVKITDGYVGTDASPITFSGKSFGAEVGSVS